MQNKEKVMRKTEDVCTTIAYRTLVGEIKGEPEEARAPT